MTDTGLSASGMESRDGGEKKRLRRPVLQINKDVSERKKMGGGEGLVQ